MQDLAEELIPRIEGELVEAHSYASALEATQEQIDVFLYQLLYNATRIGWHLWEIDLKFAPGLPPGWRLSSVS